MDEIAGHVGYYEPIFRPAYQQASQGKRHLTFGTVETIISGAFPAASFQATLFADPKNDDAGCLLGSGPGPQEGSETTSRYAVTVWW